jgi:hypothetical protein
MCLRHVRLEVPAGASFFLAALPARSRPYGKGVSLARSEAGPTRLGAEPPGASPAPGGFYLAVRFAVTTHTAGSPSPGSLALMRSSACVSALGLPLSHLKRVERVLGGSEIVTSE